MKKKHGVFFGFAVLLIAAIFTLAGCDNGTGGGDDNNNNNNNNNNNGFTAGWPPASVLTAYGLSAISAPTDATNVEYQVVDDGVNDGLLINFHGSSAHDTVIGTWFTSNSWAKDDDSSWDDETGVYWVFEKAGFDEATYGRGAASGNCTIAVLKVLN
jgi:hypothetical protein